MAYLDNVVLHVWDDTVRCTGSLRSTDGAIVNKNEREGNCMPGACHPFETNVTEHCVAQTPILHVQLVSMQRCVTNTCKCGFTLSDLIF